jgi:hypothetical protein
MSDDNLATTPIRELIASFRKQIAEFPVERMLDMMILSTITTRLELQADEIDALSAENHILKDRYETCKADRADLRAEIADLYKQLPKERIP